MAEKRFNPEKGERREQLEFALRERLADARALHDSGRAVASIMMGVYCLEIALKVQICRRLDLDALPRPFQTHDLEDLLVLSGLSRVMKQPGSEHIDLRFRQILGDYGNLDKLRYGQGAEYDQNQSGELLERLGDPNPEVEGLLGWLSRQT